MSSVEVSPAGGEDAADVHAVVHAAFEARPALDPPAVALTETASELADRLATHGGLLARVDVASLRRRVDDYIDDTNAGGAIRRAQASLDEIAGFERE